MIWTKAVSKIEVSAGVPSLLFQRQRFSFSQVDRAHRRKIKKLSFGAFALHSDKVFLDKKFSFSQLHRHATTSSLETKTSKTISSPSNLITFHSATAYLVPWSKSPIPLATSSTFSDSATHMNDALHFQFSDNMLKKEQIKSPYLMIRAYCDLCMNSKLKKVWKVP